MVNKRACELLLEDSGLMTAAKMYIGLESVPEDMTEEEFEALSQRLFKISPNGDVYEISDAIEAAEKMKKHNGNGRK